MYHKCKRCEELRDYYRQVSAEWRKAEYGSPEYNVYVRALRKYRKHAELPHTVSY